MRGEISSARFDKRHPLDWYVDPVWCSGQLIKHMARFRHEKVNGYAIWDPCCGMGNTMDAFIGEGFKVYLSDVVDNVDWDSRDYRRFPTFTERDHEYYQVPEWFSADFLELNEAPAKCSIVFNPPYSYKKGIAEAFVRQALRLSSNLVCALLPNKWLSSQARYQLFEIDHPPAQVLHLTQRPSMPPGDRIKLMANRAFRGGMIDYCWIIWDVQNPTPRGETRVRWLPRLGEAA